MSGGDSAPATLEDNVGVRIARLADIFFRLARLGVEGPTGLRQTDLRILNLLDGSAGLSIAALARRTHIDKAWISRSIQSLTERCLVERQSDPADSRAVLIRLTPAGRDLLDGIRPAVRDGERLVLDGIDEPALKHSLDRLLDNAEIMLADAESATSDRGRAYARIAKRRA